MFINTDFLKDNKIQLILEKTVDGNIMKEWVPAYHFAICDNNGIKMGVCDLRIGYNDKLYYGGNTGYRIYENTEETIMQKNLAIYYLNWQKNMDYNI